MCFVFRGPSILRFIPGIVKFCFVSLGGCWWDSGGFTLGFSWDFGGGLVGFGWVLGRFRGGFWWVSGWVFGSFFTNPGFSNFGNRMLREEYGMVPCGRRENISGRRELRDSTKVSRVW